MIIATPGGAPPTFNYVSLPGWELLFAASTRPPSRSLPAGSIVSGQYSVKEPGGSVRVVRYHADKDGFHAVVHTSGQNDHSSGVYGGQGRGQVHVQQAAAQQEQGLHDYAASYAPDEEY